MKTKKVELRLEVNLLELLAAGAKQAGVTTEDFIKVILYLEYLKEKNDGPESRDD